MISKVIEEALENLIRRIEDLENKMKGIPQAILNSKQPIQFQQKSGQATPGQVKYIRILKGDIWPEMTKQEAGKEIDRLLKEKVTNSHSESKVTEPKEVDTDDVGLDSEGLM